LSSPQKVDRDPGNFWTLGTQSCILKQFWGSIQSQYWVMKIKFFSLFRERHKSEFIIIRAFYIYDW
jgi:hypothetical protein